ncbi:MAG: hypothetical protein MJ236_06615, partial [Clostridia bacterium]|nr:hypothetical protein [Clostridia bacterium]
MASFERFASAVSRLEHKVNVTAGNILCDGRNAFPITDTIEFSINAPSNTVSAQMIILTDSNKCISRFDLQKVDDKYTIRIPMDSL